MADLLRRRAAIPGADPSIQASGQLSPLRPLERRRRPRRSAGLHLHRADLSRPQSERPAPAARRAAWRRADRRGVQRAARQCRPIRSHPLDRDVRRAWRLFRPRRAAAHGGARRPYRTLLVRPAGLPGAGDPDLAAARPGRGQGGIRPHQPAAHGRRAVAGGRALGPAGEAGERPVGRARLARDAAPRSARGPAGARHPGRAAARPAGRVRRIAVRHEPPHREPGRAFGATRRLDGAPTRRSATAGAKPSSPPTGSTRCSRRAAPAA